MSTVNKMHLRRAGPIDPANGFPMWFEDDAGTKLELVLDNDPHAPVIGKLPFPNNPLRFPENFPDESFYFAAEAQLQVGGMGVVGRARVILHLEAAFGGAGSPRQDMNVVFARIRVRMDDLIPGARYVVTHPYGVTDELEADDRGRVFHTEDLGIAERDPTAVVHTGRIAPFLRSNPAPLDASYIGDGNNPERVTGSPITIGGVPVNYVEIAGPNINPAGGDRVRTDVFTLQGRVAKRLGAWVDRATYDSTGGGVRITVAARAAARPGGTPNDLRVTGSGLHFKLQEQGEHFVGIGDVATVSALKGAQLVNLSDDPPTSFPLFFSPAIVVEQAAHDLDSKTFTLHARCLLPAATLTVKEPALAVTSSPQVFTNLAAVPASIELVAMNGPDVVATARAPVLFSGSLAAALPVQASASASPAALEAGQPVTLDGLASAGATAYAWAQTSGAAVAITNANTGRATFTPTVAGAYTFKLTVQGLGGPASATVNVAVSAVPAADVFTGLTAQYRTRRRQYLIQGTVGNLPNKVMVRAPNGTEIGSESADNLGAWRVRVSLPASVPAPASGDVVTVVARIGNATTTPIVIRN